MARPRALACWLAFAGVFPAATLSAAEPATPMGATNSSATNASVAISTNTGPRFDVQSYVLNYNRSVFTNVVEPVLSAYAGTNVDTGQILQAASAVLSEFKKQGYPSANVSISTAQITNGVVDMYVYNGVYPQVLISGKSYRPVGEAEITTTTNGPPATNAVPHFSIVGYEVVGNTLLTDETLESIFSKYSGTNVTKDDVDNAQKDLVLEYQDRGFATVNVVRPPQVVTNGIIRLVVTEGTLAEINVVSNRYYSSNNVMRALPSLQTNMILNDKVLAAEFDRANANQDRQIYAMLTNGPSPGTSRLDLVVKDRFPMHGKVELNNQASPGTPALRLNGSAVYNNLWQLNHSLGVQYSASPEVYKQGDQWKWYDQPLVANYSGFYRLPLGNPASVADIVESQPGSFGFNEATRKFNLPPPSGTAELNLYASRSTIDTGAEAGAAQTVLDIPGVRQVFQQNFQEDVTVNEDLGFRLSEPLPQTAGVRSTFAFGLDLKTYVSTITKTNVFNFAEYTFDQNGNPLPPIISSVDSPVPVTVQPVQYLPVSLRYDGTWRDGAGPAALGMGLAVNTWYSGSLANLRGITASTKSSGHWVALTPSLSQDIVFHGNWILTARADGQWASEPLISTEQFGTGGVASVRGYQEGQVFGDTGWHLSLEQKTPGHLVGVINGSQDLIIRGSVYMDYAESYLLDPQGRPGRTPLWGTGFGVVASIGSTWEARFLFSEPLLGTGASEAFQPFFNFSLTGQF